MVTEVERLKPHRHAIMRRLRLGSMISTICRDYDCYSMSLYRLSKMYGFQHLLPRARRDAWLREKDK